MTGSSQPGSGVPAEIRTDIAHPARVYDYWILRMFNGRELVDPGLVLVSYWRPDDGDPGPNADRAWAYGGVAAIS